MRVLVSIHDVTPCLIEGVERLWTLCADRGVVPALLLVPNWHGEWPLEQHPECVRWVQGRAREGAEVLLHGERHDEVGSPRRWRDRFRAWGRTAREGEFLTLSHAEAQTRIERGIARFRALGLAPLGFVPPAWLAREETHAAVRAAGLPLSEDHHSIRLLASGRRISAPAFRWSTRTPARALASVVVAEGRWRLQRRRQVLRLALHPPDLAHLGVATSVGRTLDRLLAEGFPAQYGDLLRTNSAGLHETASETKAALAG